MSSTFLGSAGSDNKLYVQVVLGGAAGMGLEGDQIAILDGGSWRVVVDKRNEADGDNG